MLFTWLACTDAIKAYFLMHISLAIRAMKIFLLLIAIEKFVAVFPLTILAVLKLKCKQILFLVNG